MIKNMIINKNLEPIKEGSLFVVTNEDEECLVTNLVHESKLSDSKLEVSWYASMDKYTYENTVNSWPHIPENFYEELQSVLDKYKIQRLEFYRLV